MDTQTPTVSFDVSQRNYVSRAYNEFPTPFEVSKVCYTHNGSSMLTLETLKLNKQERDIDIGISYLKFWKQDPTSKFGYSIQAISAKSHLPQVFGIEASLTQNIFVSYGSDKNVKIWKEVDNTWKCIGVLAFQDKVPRDCKFFKQGRQEFLVVAFDDIVTVFNAKDLSYKEKIVASTSTIRKICVSSKGDFLLTLDSEVFYSY